MEATPSPDMPDLSAVIVSRGQIQRRVDELAGEIAAALDGRPLTLIGVMDGALIFLADLIRRLTMPIHLLTVGARSYSGRNRTPGDVRFIHPLPTPLADRHVLIVDDILDSGATLAAVSREVAAHAPASCHSCVLLRKRRSQALPPPAAEADFVGFDIPDKFVVGYGLDYNGLWRNLPDVLALENSP
jgi:hypoxanthine phosphoribosyltransferase